MVGMIKVLCSLQNTLEHAMLFIFMARYGCLGLGPLILVFEDLIVYYCSITPVLGGGFSHT